MDTQTEESLSLTHTDLSTDEAKMLRKTIVDKIKDIVDDLKAEHRSAKQSYDHKWIVECQCRLSQMYLVCQELGIDYGNPVDFI